MLNGKPPEPDAGYARALAAQQKAFETEAIARATPHSVDLCDPAKAYYTNDPSVLARRASFKAVGGNGWRLDERELRQWKPRGPRS